MKVLKVVEVKWLEKKIGRSIKYTWWILNITLTGKQIYFKNIHSLLPKENKFWTERS